jgi:predicted metal-dependent hydrolase
MFNSDDACSETLPAPAREAIALFNAGEFYRQHDLLEALWRSEPRPVRALYQGILQVGVGYYQVTRGNAQGAAKMLVRAARQLAPLPDVCQGVDVARLRADAARVLAELRRLGAARVGELDRALLRPVVYNLPSEMPHE